VQVIDKRPHVAGKAHDELLPDGTTGVAFDKAMLVAFDFRFTGMPIDDADR
jgi:hypothetical protein